MKRLLNSTIILFKLMAIRCWMDNEIKKAVLEQFTSLKELSPAKFPKLQIWDFKSYVFLNLLDQRLRFKKIIFKKIYSYHLGLYLQFYLRMNYFILHIILKCSSSKLSCNKYLLQNSEKNYIALQLTQE